MGQTVVAFDSRTKLHNPGPGHPEQIARQDAVLHRLTSSGLLARTIPAEPRLASLAELALVHQPSYIELVDREIAQHRGQLSTGDAAISPGSGEAARAAVGCALSAIDAVLTGTAQNGFCAVRPPGHHAGVARGMGFCLFNTVAVAARYAQEKYGLARVAIIDWDVHHGNGTQDIFYRDGSVLFFSTHQSPLYPGTGARSETGSGDGLGKTLNCPFPAGAGRGEILGAFNQVFAPAVDLFKPDLLLISAGFDSHIGDPLGGFTLTDADFRELTALTMEHASRHCNGRLVSVLEGGYNLEGLASAAASHVAELSGHPLA